MHFAVVTECIPNLESDGDHQTPWIITQAMLDAGHQVTSCMVLNTEHSWSKERDDIWMADFRQLGTNIITIPFKPPSHRGFHPGKLLQRLIAPPIGRFFPQHAIGSQVNYALGEAKPDAVMAIFWGAVVATHGLKTAPKMAALGAMPHALQAIRWRWASKRQVPSFLRRSLLYPLDNIHLRRMEFDVLRDWQSLVNLAMSQTSEVQRLGVKSCEYFTQPAHDLGGKDWEERRKSSGARSIFKVLLIGVMEATFSRHGLHLFADEILPVLEQRLGPEKVEVHIVGSGTLPGALAKKLDSPIVKFRGWVESAGAEYLSADVLLVPNPVQMGQRTKIMHGLSCGCCTVAHEANIVEAPELIDGQNILAGKTGGELAEAIVRAARDPGLRKRIGANGRRTFEQHYSSEAAGPKYVQEMERIASERSTSASSNAPRACEKR